jgi:hypothetical protein
MLTRKLLLLTLAAVCVASPCAAQETAAVDPRKPSGVSQVVVAVHMSTTDFRIRETKDIGVLTIEEFKSIRLTDFDFAARLGDELVSALSEDKRAQWRMAKAGEKEQLAYLFGRDSWEQNSYAPPSLESDRVLLVGAGCAADASAFFATIHVEVALRLVDCKSGKVLLKKGVGKSTRFPGRPKGMFADNQKVLKETLNKLTEQVALKVKQHVSKSPI